MTPREKAARSTNEGTGLLRTERRANRNVLEQVKKHGQPHEVEAWRRYANKQMKLGYRNNIYEGHVEAGADTLSKKKDILRQHPYLRSRFTNLGALYPGMIALGGLEASR